MIVTTTQSVEGRKIVEYKGIVFGEVISGVNVVKDMMAGLTNFFGGRSNTYETELINARQNALKEMEERAFQLGANAVVGVDIDYEVLGADNGMLRTQTAFLSEWFLQNVLCCVCHVSQWQGQLHSEKAGVPHQKHYLLFLR